jgi:hypothetical protein
MRMRETMGQYRLVAAGALVIMVTERGMCE